MRTIIFDFYGVIMKDPIGGLMPFVRGRFPDLSLDDVYSQWLKANIGKMASLDFFRNLGFEGDLGDIEKEYLDTLEIDGEFYRAADILGKRYGMAILSNDIAEWSRYLRSKFGLDDYFETAIISGEAGIKKPDRDIYELTLNRLNQRAADCIFVDDRRSNLDPAESLGIEPILFDNGRPWHDGGKGNEGYEGKTVRSFRELTEMLTRRF
jgi:putative hydrolase of the HAD superfamily